MNITKFYELLYGLYAEQNKVKIKINVKEV